MRDLLFVLSTALVLRACEAASVSGPGSAEAFGDAEIASGAWRQDDHGGNARAIFLAPDGQTLATIACDRAGIAVERTAAAEPAGAMTIRADNRVRTLPARATLDLDDRMIESLARPNGAIAIELAGAPALILPADRSIEEVVADCRGYVALP